MSKGSSLTPRQGAWKPSRCKVDGFVAYRLERQTGPCLRDDYEFACGGDGRPLEFPSFAAAAEAARGSELFELKAA